MPDEEHLFPTTRGECFKLDASALDNDWKDFSLRLEHELVFLLIRLGWFNVYQSIRVVCTSESRHKGQCATMSVMGLSLRSVK
jgi:hypothetical protein